MRDTIRENYAPRVYSQHIDKPFITLLPFTCFYFILLSKIIYTPHLLENNKTRGLTIFLPVLGAICSFFCVLLLKTIVVNIPIDLINLGFITEGNTYTHCASITRSSSRKTQRRSQVSDQCVATSNGVPTVKTTSTGQPNVAFWEEGRRVMVPWFLLGR